MLYINTLRNKEMRQSGTLDEESERRKAEMAGMLDQTEVRFVYLRIYLNFAYTMIPILFSLKTEQCDMSYDAS